MFELAQGQTLNQRFTLIRKLGTGGMGDVWLVEDRELDERLVVKIVPADAPQERVDLLRRECRHARKLVHPNIVPVYDFHRGDDVSFLTMAYVEGTDIGRFRGAALDTILDLLIPIADALHHAHLRGVVHRDLKIGNVLVDGTGNPHLVDFGIAGLLDGDESLARGGGTEDAPSPQQRSGHPPSVADDIHAFGMLIRELAPQPFPAELAQYVRRLTSFDPHQRPRDMAEVKRALDEMRRSARVAPPPKKPLRLTPPPRVADAAPPDVPALPLSPRQPETGSRGIGWKTLVAFGASFCLAAIVFFALPDWVERSPGQAEVDPVAPTTIVEAEQLAETPDLAELAEHKTRAEQARARAEELRGRLDSQRVTSWGLDTFRAAVEEIERGDALMVEKSYDPAAEVFEGAASDLSALASESSTVAREALERGQRALSAGDRAAAEEAFSLALAIQPGNGAARSGLSRARVLDDVLGWIARGENLERGGDVEGAVAAYRKAIELDALSETAQRALARIDSRASELAFTSTMSEGMTALGQQDFARAREAFVRAKAMRPESSDVRDGLIRAEEGIRLQAIAEHRDRALENERTESWRKAESEYDAVLALDPTIRFAQEGKERTTMRAGLDEKLDFHLNHETRLSDPEVRAEAAGSLREAVAIEPKGPKLQEQVKRLQVLVQVYSTPVEVLLLSDEKTEVVVYKVGRLGTFLRHSLTLTPGTYTIVGSREGFRDVRHQLVVSADERPEPLLVRCEEEI